MQRLAFCLLACLFTAGSLTAHAQVAPAAKRGQLSITVGGLFSAFQPDYAGNGIAKSSPNTLFGFGAYADIHMRRWFEVEAEGRWNHLNEYLNISQDNYLIGPKVPIHEFHYMHATPYGKFLVGMTKMNFEYDYAYGRFTTLAYGGGVDLKLTKRLSYRPVDFEYQQLPDWVRGTLNPYGFSTGIGYKIF
ncbi:MAG: outer membrane beta-barrel protein [Terracidiphilus sp.]